MIKSHTVLNIKTSLSLSLNAPNLLVVFRAGGQRAETCDPPSGSVRSPVWTRLFSLLGRAGLHPAREAVYILQAQQNVTFDLHTLFSKGHN